MLVTDVSVSCWGQQSFLSPVPLGLGGTEQAHTQGLPKSIQSMEAVCRLTEKRASSPQYLWPAATGDTLCSPPCVYQGCCFQSLCSAPRPHLCPPQRLLLE